MKPVLVLGANGFLGSHVCEALERQTGDCPWVGVARRPARPTKPTLSSWISLDLVVAPTAAYERLFTRVDPCAVVNCAGATIGDPASLHAANIGIVRKLVTVMSAGSDACLIHFGSAAEYGPQPTDVPVAESATPHPSSLYGISKLKGTEVAVAAFEDGRIAGTVLRVFNPVGARAPESSLAGRAARAMWRAMCQHRKSITLGSLDAQRDFVAATDVGAVAAKAAQTSDLPEILNVGRGVATSGAALITLLQEVAAFDCELIECGAGSPRSSWVSIQRADVSLLRDRIGWVPSTPLARAVADLWASVAA
jgi:NDP-hexose 4-ketoreductase